MWTFFREVQEEKTRPVDKYGVGFLDDWLVRSCMKSENLTNIYGENHMESSMK